MESDTDKFILFVCSITLTPITTEQGEARILLRRAMFHQYSLLPQSPELQQEIHMNAPLTNGDVLVATICEGLHEEC